MDLSEPNAGTPDSMEGLIQRLYAAIPKRFRVRLARPMVEVEVAAKKWAAAQRAIQVIVSPTGTYDDYTVDAALLLLSRLVL